MASADDTSNQVRHLTLTVTDAEAGVRLDRFIVAGAGDLTRQRVQALIRAGAVTSGGGTIGDPGLRVKPGTTYLLHVPDAVPAQPAPEAMPLAVVYEDAHLIVIDKPAGLVVHPAAGHESGTLVNALIAHCGESLSGIGGVRRPGIVHRLDKETSGLLVVAKSDAAHQGLSEQFAAHGADGRLERRYVALVWGVPTRAKGRIEAAIARATNDRTRMAVVRGAAGRHAATNYEVVARYGAPGQTGLASRLDVRLETGRTHQIRVHMAHAGHPVLGDPVYTRGFKEKSRKLGSGARAALEALGRQALHAASLGFEHPVTGRALCFESPLPADMERLVAALEAETGAEPAPASWTRTRMK